MSVVSHSSRFYCDIDDINGVCNVLARRIKSALTCEDAAFYRGAYSVLDILRNKERLNTQADFFTVFDAVYGTENNNYREE